MQEPTGRSVQPLLDRQRGETVARRAKARGDGGGGDFPFTPPNRGAIWMRLALNASQVANLCGVTLRQVIHWADREYLPRSPHDPSAFTGHAVDV